MIFLIVLLLLTPLPVCAFDKWDTADKTLATVAVLAAVVDWRQTRVIAANPDKYEEKNPVMGSHPSKAKVDLIFGLQVAANLAIAHVLPSNYRKMWLGAGIALSVYCIANNVGIGVGIQW